MITAVRRPYLPNRLRALAIVVLTVLGVVSLRAQDGRSAPPAAPPAAPVDIVVQGAVDGELQPLLAALEGREQIQVAAWTFWRGRLAGKNVVVSRTEVGPMNASVATTLAIERFRPRLIVNQGTAGAVDPSLKIFDIVVGEASVDYGAFQSSHADAGQGVDQARWTPLPHRIRLDGKERVEFFRFPGDPDAIAVALATPNPRGRVVRGVIGSAFEFNREIDRLVWIRKVYGAASEDMESAFSAGAAAGFKVPFLAVRIISDNEFTAPEFQRIAGEYCAAFVVDMLTRFPGARTDARE